MIDKLHLYSYLFEFLEGLEVVEERLVHGPEPCDEALLLFPDAPFVNEVRKHYGVF